MSYAISLVNHKEINPMDLFSQSILPCQKLHMLSNIHD